MSRRIPAVGSLFVVAACGNQPLNLEGAAQSAIVMRGRPCRSDAIYIDVPLAKNPTWTDTSFLPALAQSIAIPANNGVQPDWFCGSGQVTCPVGSALVIIEPVLEPR